MTVRNQNLIQKEIKGRLKSGNALLPFGAEPSVFGARGTIVVKALCYKPEGRRFATR
jgi:hypothetical protein